MKKILTVLVVGIIIGILLIVLLNRFYPLGNIFRSSGDLSSSNSSDNSFYKVTEKLDKGGDLYFYMNTKRVNAMIRNLINEINNTVNKNMEFNTANKKKADSSITFINTLFDKLGAFDIDGVGFSTLKNSDNLTRTKFVLNRSTKKEGRLLWNILGKNPSDMTYINLIPEDTVFAQFSNIDFSFFRNWIYDLAKNSGIKDFENGIKNLEPSLLKAGVDLKKIFDSIKGYSGIILTSDEKNRKKVPRGDKTISIPDPGLALIFQVKNGYIFDLIEKKYPGVEKSDKKGIKKLLLKGMPKLPITFNPQIILKDNILFFSSGDHITKNILDSISGKNRITANTEFKNMSLNMPKKGNSFTFLSKRLFKTVVSITKLSGDKTNPAFGIMDKIGFSLDKISVYRVTENSEDGMIITSNSTLKPEAAFLLPVIITAGITSAVAIPNFINATNKAKFKRSMMSMKMIGSAIEYYHTDKGALPDAQTIEELEKTLIPFYIKTFPRFDGWGNPFLYKYDKENGKYFIGCSGKNGIFDGWSQTGKYKIRYSTDYLNDIILSNGEFVYSPEN